MKYVVNEIQTSFEGQVSNLVTVYDDQFDAESAYHQILAYAAKSNLMMHTAMLYTNDGNTLRHETYTHPMPESNSNE